MGYSEKRGKYYRARWRNPAGELDSMSGFLTKKAAENFANDQEAAIRAGRYVDPRAGQITVEEWVRLWFPSLDLELSTLENYRGLLSIHILPVFGQRSLASIAAEEVAAWEKSIVQNGGYAPRTARDARSMLCTVLQAAVPARIQFNPAARKRATGKKATRRIARIMEGRREWATPLEAFLVAERVAALSGHDSDFIRLVMIAYTGMRWGESCGLSPEYVHEDYIDVEWQLYELKGMFLRGYPKDGSIRPVDIPPFLGQLLGRQTKAATRCTCTGTDARFCTGGVYMFLGPERGHARRSDFARRFFRPAADGWYASRGQVLPMPVLADVREVWPGFPLPPWPAAERGQEFTPPRLGTRRPVRQAVNSRSTRAELVKYAEGRGMRRAEAEALSREALLDRFVRSAYLTADAASLVSWLPVKAELTVHGLRHSHETWMEEDRIAGSLRDERMGHTAAGSAGRETVSKMGRHYTHVSDVMREELAAALQRRWERSLAERAELERLWAEAGVAARSPVPIVNELLEPFRANISMIGSHSAPRIGQRRQRKRPLPRGERPLTWGGAEGI